MALHTHTPSPEDFPALARALLGSRTGIISRLGVLPRGADELELWNITARMARLGALPGGSDIADPGATHYTREGAYRRALMEAVERYCAAVVDYPRLIRTAPLATGPFLLGDELPLFADHQYERPGWPFRKLTLHSEIRWVDGRSLMTGRRRLIPASLVYVPYDFGIDDERLGPSTSTGMAASFSRPQAVLTGLLEVCERDAFTIMWMNRLSMPRLRVAPDGTLGRMVAEVQADGSTRATFVDLTNDLGVPVVLCQLRRRHFDQMLPTIGLGAHPTLAGAAAKAFLEAGSEYVRLRDTLARPGPRWEPAKDFTNVSDFPWHSLVYADPRHEPALSFICASETERPLGEPVPPLAGPEELLIRYGRQLEERGVEAFVIDLTTSDIARLGVSAVKVFAPRAVPLHPHHLAPWLGHPRLYEVPRTLGYTPRATTVADLNLAMPHPFA